MTDLINRMRELNLSNLCCPCKLFTRKWINFLSFFFLFALPFLSLLLQEIDILKSKKKGMRTKYSQVWLVQFWQEFFFPIWIWRGGERGDRRRRVGRERRERDLDLSYRSSASAAIRRESWPANQLHHTETEMRINSYWATVRLRWLLFRSQKTTNQLRMRK